MAMKKLMGKNRKVQAILAVCGLALVGGLPAATISYVADETVSVPLAMTEDTTIDVATGKTVTYDANAVISGAYALTKAGQGKLILVAANTFTGGVTLDAGYLCVSNDQALGTGDLTILGQRDGYSGPCELDIMGAGKNEAFVRTLANDIYVTGTSTLTYPALVPFGQNAVLSGKVTAAHDLAFHEDKDSTVAIASSYWNRYTLVTSLTFNDEVNVVGAIIADGWTKYVYNGSVTAGSFDHNATAFVANNGNGNQQHVYNGVVNVAGDIVNHRHYLVFNNVVNTAGAWDWRFLKSVGYAGGVTLGTTGVSVGALVSGVDGSVYNAGDWRINYSNTALKTLTVRGLDREDQIPTNVVTIMQFWYKLSIDIDAYPGFTQVFAGGRTNDMSGALSATRGGMRITGATQFPKVSSVVVGAEGVFSNESTVASSLKGVTSMSVDGVFASTTQPFTQDNLTLSLGSNAEFSLPEGTTLTVKSLTHNGVLMPAGRYDSSSLPQLRGCSIISTSGASSGASAVWNGNGAVTEPANWGGDLPALNNYTVQATFAAGGSHADFDMNAKLFGISFAAPAGTTGFELRNEGGSLSLSSGGLALDGSDNATAKTYVLSVPTEFVANQTWTIPSNQTLVVDGAIENAYGKITVEGTCGNLQFRGTNMLEGAIVSTATVVEVTGLIATPGHVSQGLASQGGANTLTFLGEHTYENPRVYALTGGRLFLTNAVIEKPLYVSYSGNHGIDSRAGTTNVLKGHVAWPVPWMGFTVERNSELIFEGGFTAGWSHRTFGDDRTGVIRIRKTPISAVQSVGWNINSGTVSFEVASNLITKISTGFYNNATTPALEFKTSYAFSEERDACLLNGYFWSDAGGGLFPRTMGSADIFLNDTTQRVATLCGSANSRFSGRWPATIEVLKQCEAGTQLVAKNMFLSSEIEGNVTIAMYGTENPLILTNRAFASYGDILVAAGTLEFTADASWLNGTNVTVSGTGRLKIGQGATFDRKHAVIRFADSGKIEIPEGVMQTFYEGWNGDTPLRQGMTYTAAELPEHIAGAGAIHIARHGTYLMFR